MFPDLTAATVDDAPALASLYNRVADALGARHGQGHWSRRTTVKGILHGWPYSRVWVARSKAGIVGTVRLATRKPWAIDPAYFTDARRPLYLVGLAVAPERQGQGVGRELLRCADRVALDWGGDFIRLDAYDSPAGAGGFYLRCGYQRRGHVVYRGVGLIYFERRC